MQCPSCAAVVPSESRFCLTCGRPLGTPSELATMAAAPEAAAVAGPHVRRLASSDSVPVGGFTPGIILADRYRIIGLLGRGGMGEVYRADDLKLGQPVALKFLPRALAGDPVRRERFFAEVRITRQLSHPNICRVYDIAEVNGQHFLSMEYIDGEDLASLLPRIGYLSNEKALDIARQLVAGLAAAHERGVLHRDLKPANVMIDGRGRVRITDFGLAVAATDEVQAAEMSGTPAYMAPEQLAGKGATVRSDLYALGLVLYELYTGKRAFNAPTLADLREQKERATPTAPSELRPGIDPVVERVIARCLERDPRQRPASAAQLAASLPGGDPLAAAIAAGETPSPEMVAASGGQGQLRPIVGVSLLVIAATASVLLVAMMALSSLPRRVPFNLPPAVLANEARQILNTIGYPEPPGDSAFGLDYDREYIASVGQVSNGPRRWEKLDSRAILLWYRQSARPLEHKEFMNRPTVTLTPVDPPLQYSGDALLFVDTEGRLRRLEVLAPQEIAADAVHRDVDWSVLFKAAGLEIANWRAIEPRWNPLHYGDARASWEGTLPPFEVPARIEAAAYRGVPVWFDIVLPSTKPSREPGSVPSAPAPETFGVLVLVTFTVGAAFFARRNLRMGRGDRRGAPRARQCGPGHSRVDAYRAPRRDAVGAVLCLLERERHPDLVESLLAWIRGDRAVRPPPVAAGAGFLGTSVGGGLARSARRTRHRNRVYGRSVGRLSWTDGVFCTGLARLPGTLARYSRTLCRERPARISGVGHQWRLHRRHQRAPRLSVFPFRPAHPPPKHVACRRRRGAGAHASPVGKNARRIRAMDLLAFRARRKHCPAFRVDSIRIPRTGSSRLCVRRTHLVSPDVRGVILVRGIRLRRSRGCRSARVVRLQDVAWRPPAV
jgi:hypothetical protein